ncbi:MAG: DUF6625 family protein [Methylocystis sp.]
MITPRILIFVQWFGPWPPWMRCFLESCRWNPTVNWLLIGDAPQPEDLPRNVRLKQVTFDDYRALFSKKLGVGARWTDVYKLCDLKPALAAVHDLEVDGYDYWGYCDIDVIFGDIRQFYTPQILVHDLVTTHADILSGHFTLFRNSPRMVNAFRGIPFWRRLFDTPRHKSFDEQIFSRLFLPFPRGDSWRRLFTPFLGGALCVERYSTNIPPRTWIDGSADWPEKWFWERGRLTTNGSGDQEFLYLHFSCWQSNRWTSEAVAPWKRLERLDALPPGRVERFTISARGFTPTDDADLTRGDVSP